MRDLSLHLMDIIQNSIEAKAKRIYIEIAADKDEDEMKILVEDNGIGMDKWMVEKVTDPFTTSRTSRKVGLGIPLFKASTEMTGGSFKIESEKGKGTRVIATLKISHIDRLPLGDISETIVNVIAAYPEIDIELKLNNTRSQNIFKLSEIKEHLRGIPVNEVKVLEWIREYINEAVKDIFGGVLSEIYS